MLDMVQGTFTSRLAAEPSTPVVVSVPHAGVRTAGFDAALAPELDVRGDADLYVDRLYRLGEDGGPETSSPRVCRASSATSIAILTTSARARSPSTPSRATPTGAASSGPSRPSAHQR